MNEDDILLETEDNMEKSVAYLEHELASVRTGKASPALVENLDVQAYGASMKLKQFAMITTPESRLIVIQPFDASTVRPIEVALRESKLGINPAVDGRIIRLPIPELNEERRRDLVKAVRHMAEEARVRVRSNRHHGIDSIKRLHKEAGITDDDAHRLEKEVQKLTDTHIRKIDEHLKHKEAEIMTV